MMRKIYIASPYSSGDAVLNVRESLRVADILVSIGANPFAPLLSHFWHFYSPKDYETWLRLDLDWVQSCDALLRLPGESEGADREVAEARRLGIPVFSRLDELGVWLERTAIGRGEGEN